MQVVSGSISAGVSREWNLLEAEFEFGDLSNLSELSIYMGGTPTDSSFYLDEVITHLFGHCVSGVPRVITGLEGGSKRKDRGSQEK